MSVELLAIDIGTVNIGYARASMSVKIPEPLDSKQYSNDLAVIEHIKMLKNEFDFKFILIGNPFVSHSKETDYFKFYQRLASKIEFAFSDVVVVFVDESYSSQEALQLKRIHGSSKGLDSLSACVIINRYIQENHI